MAKGSQLAQLKSALSQAGITRQPSSGKKRKRSASQEHDKAKKAAKLEEIRRQLNQFDVKVTKLKHDVGGRKLKGVTGHPAQSKQAGLEQRKKTLLKEYEERGRAGGILDRRFGENDPSLSLEDRMLERFTRERQRAAKGAVFNLEDEEELTHYGQSLSKLDDFDDLGLRLDDEEDENTGQIDHDIVKKTHFGGFGDKESEEEEPSRKRSKAEIMAEVIAKSKEHKYQRQMEREKDENIRHQLDQEFNSLRSLLTVPGPSISGQDAVVLDTDDSHLFLSAETQNDEYDHHVRELAFDKRAKAKDRTKTEEEIALEDKEALERAERRRKRRMVGEDYDSEEEGRKARGQRKGVPDADDLDDDLGEEDEWGGLGPGLTEAVGGTRQESNSGNDEESEEEEGNDESEQDDDSEGGEDQEWSSSSIYGKTDDHQDRTPAPARHKGKSKELDKELPFTFPCPTTHEELLDILEGIDEKDVPTVIQRVRALHHPSLGPDNTTKLHALTGVLVDHVVHITSPPNPRIALLASLLPHLTALTKSYPAQSAQQFVRKIASMHEQLKRDLQAQQTGSRSPWPDVSGLCFLRVIGVIWSTSDMHHSVVTPAKLLMGAYLGLCRVRSLADIACGLFLCTLFLDYEASSKRLVPEAVNFIVNTILHLAPHIFKDVASLPGTFPAPDFGALSLSLGGVRHDVKARKPKLFEIMKMSDQGSDETQAKADLFGLSLELTEHYAEAYNGLEGFVDLFEPIGSVLQGIEASRLPLVYQPRLTRLVDCLRRHIKFARQARRRLRLQAHKPIPIATYVPKFASGTSSSYLRVRDPDEERGAASKLRRAHREARKGAIRELRKDARFLGSVQREKQRERDAEYAAWLHGVHASMEGERAEAKSLEREKARAKRRSGRK